MRTARLMTNSTVHLWAPPKITDHTDPEYPHYLSMGGFGMFVDDATINDLALTIIQRMYDKNTNASRDTINTLAHLTSVMADDRGYEDAAADTLYDQYVDDAVIGA